MEPEGTQQTDTRKKILIITIVVVLFILGVLGGYLFLERTFVKEPVNVIQTFTQEKKVYSEVEKEDILNQVTVASSSSKGERIEGLLLLNKTPVKQSATTLPDLEKFKLLNAIQIK